MLIILIQSIIDIYVDKIYSLMLRRIKQTPSKRAHNVFTNNNIIRQNLNRYRLLAHKAMKIADNILGFERFFFKNKVGVSYICYGKKYE